MSVEKSRTVLITGAARGIGQAIAAEYQRAGWSVVAPTRNELDLASAESVERFLAGFRVEVDALVNNAGENKLSRIERLDLGEWERILKINLTGPMRLMKHCAVAMRAKQWGRIVNISSCYSIVSREARASYSSSKSGLNGLTRTAAIEWGKDGVLVNALCPGFVETDLTRANNSPEQIAALAAQIPLERLARPEEIAKIAVFLGTQQNTYITGQTIIADGGLLIQ